MSATATEKPWLPADCARVVAEVEARLAAKDAGAIEREVTRLGQLPQASGHRRNVGTELKREFGRLRCPPCPGERAVDR